MNGISSTDYHPCDEFRRRQHQINLSQKLKMDLDNITTEKKQLQKAWLELDKQYEAVSKTKDQYREKASVLEKEMSRLNEKLTDVQGNLETLKLKYREKCENFQRSTDAEYEATRKAASLQHEVSKLRDEISIMQRDREAIEAEYRYRVNAMEQRLNELDDPGQRYYIDQIAEMARAKEDLVARLKRTEENYGELRRDHEILRNQLQNADSQLRQSADEFGKLVSEKRELTEKLQSCTKDKEYYEKLYKSFKEETLVDLKKLNTKIAQQEKLMEHLQSLIQSSPKKCCQKSKPDKQISDDPRKSLDAERSKNMELEDTVRQLKQQLVEERLRRSVANEADPTIPIEKNSQNLE